jgi:hypothetical protein
MRHIAMLAACAAVCLESTAFAAEEEAPPRKESTALDKRLLLPNLAGFGYEIVPTGNAMLGLSSGLFSYGSSSGDDGSRSHVFTVRPAFDVRVGRLTLGTDSSFAYVETSSMAQDLTTFGLRIVPRVGYLVPITTGVAFWPRVGAGFTYGTSNFSQTTASIKGGVGSIDALFALSLGSHLLVTAGPTLSASYTQVEPGPSTWHLGVGGALGLGLAI